MLLDEFLAELSLLIHSCSEIIGIGALTVLSEATDVIVEDIDRDL